MREIPTSGRSRAKGAYHEEALDGSMFTPVLMSSLGFLTLNTDAAQQLVDLGVRMSTESMRSEEVEIKNPHETRKNRINPQRYLDPRTIVP